MTISSSPRDVNAHALDITANLQEPTKGVVHTPRGRFPCALGRGGVSEDKREGDGKTPLGVFTLRRVLYRADRRETPVTGLPVRAIRPDDGWCDDPTHGDYNTLVRLPFEATHEELWRNDSIYDVIVELGYNDRPPVPGLGSAIFLHLARPHFSPTEGCVAISRSAMDRILPNLNKGSSIRIRRAE